MLAYSHPSSFQSINALAASKSDGAIDPTLAGSAAGLLDGESSFWDAYKGMGFSSPSLGGGAENMWPLQTQLGQLGGSNMRNGQPTPPQDMSPHTALSHHSFSMDDGNESMAEEKVSGSKKRSRAAKEPKRKSRKNSKIEFEDTSHLNPEELAQREKFLERNRVAASKCRQKKKEWTNSLEERARELQAQREMLVAYVSMLRNELLMLKCKCLEHSDCECERLREYLKNTVATLPPASANLYKLSRIEDDLRKPSMSYSEDGNDGVMQSRPTSVNGESPGLDFLNIG